MIAETATGWKGQALRVLLLLLQRSSIADSWRRPISWPPRSQEETERRRMVPPSGANTSPTINLTTRESTGDPAVVWRELEEDRCVGGVVVKKKVGRRAQRSQDRGDAWSRQASSSCARFRCSSRPRIGNSTSQATELYKRVDAGQPSSTGVVREVPGRRAWHQRVSVLAATTPRATGRTRRGNQTQRKRPPCLHSPHSSRCGATALSNPACDCLTTMG